MMNLHDRVVHLLGRSNYAPLDAQGLARRLSLPDKQYPELRRVLDELEQAGRVARIRHDRFTLPEDADLIGGRILMNRSGAGLLQPDDPKVPRIVVPAEATGTAFHLDRVLVRREVRPPGPGRPEPEVRAKVIRILERARARLVGTLQRSQQFLYVIPDDPRIPHDIYVPPPAQGRLRVKVGDKVVVELGEWISRHNNPEGRVVETLGRPDQPGVEMESVLRQYELPSAFPPAVLHESEAFGDRVRPGELGGRRDCRHQNVVTIDPEDAKDFDDAVCFEPFSNNRWKLWVHIADVSHYVQPGSAIDTEAQERGNSTYLVDRVIPMLPERLSNELCSLKPHVDRLTKCVEFVLAGDGRVLQTDFYPAVIHSRQRYTYEDAYAVLRRHPGNGLEQMLSQANQLAQRIRRTRIRAGALDLNMRESKLRLDEQGHLLRVDQVENDLSHQLIEEFMLLANEAAALRLKTRRLPGLYRIHEPPDRDRLAECEQQLRLLGVRCGNLSRQAEAQQVLQRLRHHPAGDVLRVAFLRVLKRARYAAEPMGHYGLAKANYTHFTSPIRRYADLVVHRALFQKGTFPEASLSHWADHLSFTERKSADAEQDSKTAKILAHLQTQLRTGNRPIYEATVTDVRNFGFFIDVPDLAFGGLVRVSSLEDDFYQFIPDRLQLRGRRRHRTISVGSRLEVRIAAVDPFKKLANFALVQKPGPGPKRRGERVSRGARGGRSGATGPAPGKSPQTVHASRSKSRRSDRSFPRPVA